MAKYIVAIFHPLELLKTRIQSTNFIIRERSWWKSKHEFSTTI